jgi:hypothetical protein
MQRARLKNMPEDEDSRLEVGPRTPEWEALQILVLITQQHMCNGRGYE